MRFPTVHLVWMGRTQPCLPTQNLHFFPLPTSKNHSLCQVRDQTRACVCLLRNRFLSLQNQLWLALYTRRLYLGHNIRWLLGRTSEEENGMFHLVFSVILQILSTKDLAKAMNTSRYVMAFLNKHMFCCQTSNGDLSNSKGANKTSGLECFCMMGQLQGEVCLSSLTKRKLNKKVEILDVNFKT